MGIAVAIFSSTWQLLLWLPNLARVGILRVQLQRERSIAKGLLQLRDLQLSRLRGGDQAIVHTGIQHIRYNIQNKESEPYIGVALWLINGSLFRLELNSPRLRVFEGGGGRPLVATPTLEASPPPIGPGEQIRLSFLQPVTQETRERLISAIENSARLTWLLQFDTDFAVQETGDLARYTNHQLHVQHIPD